MHILKKSVPLAILSLATLVPLAHSQEAFTTPVGAMTYSFPATTQLTSTYISVPLSSQPVFSGKVLTVGTNTLSFAGTPFTSGSLAQAGAPHFLRVQSGTQAGRMLLITANTANTLTVDTTDNSAQTTNLDTDGFAVAVDDQAQVVPGDTLASFLGDNTPGNPVAFVGAGSALQADTVNVYNKSTGRLDIYFYSTTLNYWRTNTTTDNRNSLIIYPDSSIVINRRANRPAVALTVVGEVPTVAPINKTTGSSQVIYSGSRYPTDMTLGSLNLQNWTKANSALQADTISIHNTSTGRLDVFFQRLDNSWRRVGDSVTDQSSKTVPAGSALVFLKRTAVSNQTSFLKSPLPYTL